jgi:hypothetical protein
MNASDCSPRSSEPFDIGIAGSGFFARYEEYGDVTLGLWVSFLEPVI